MKGILLHFSFLFLITVPSIAQEGLGIGTTTPRTTLDVNGSVKINGSLNLPVVNNLQNGESTAFVIRTAANDIQTLDLSVPGAAALGYIQRYNLNNTNQDFVQNFDTRISATDFVVTVISANFNSPVHQNGVEYSVPYYSAFIQGGTWRLTANYPGATDFVSNVGLWVIDTLIFSKNLAKQFATVTVNMSGNSAGAAVIPIVD